MGLQTHPGLAPKQPRSSIKKGNARVSAHKASDLNLGVLSLIVNSRCDGLTATVLTSFGKAPLISVVAHLNLQPQSDGAHTC